jgi:mono/diheme cytochrome c family protein
MTPGLEYHYQRELIHLVNFRRYIAAVVLGGALSAAALVAADQKVADPITQEESKKLVNPLPNTKASIATGKTKFLQNCTGCHGEDGKAELALVAEATDLTAPKLYKNGTTEGEIFKSIRDGAGVQMPPFKDQLTKDEEIWNLVNFIRSIWPEGVRPAVKDK